MDDLDLEGEPFDRSQNSIEDMTDAVMISDEPDEIQRKVSSASLDLQGRPYDYVYRLAHQFFQMAKEGTLKNSHIEALASKLSSFSLHDQHPTQTLHRMVVETYDKLETYKEIQTEKESIPARYARFLTKVSHHIPSLSQKSQVFLKNVMNLINHDLRR